MSSPAPRPRPAPVAPTVLLELDLGDQELVVAEYPDGVIVLRVDDHPLRLDAAQLESLVAAFRTLGTARGWT